MRILITGGAGFVGSSLAKSFIKNNPNYEVVVFDNLKRRGSEINLKEFKKIGISFIHGDVRHQEDIFEINNNFDLLIDASAEPSVHAGINGNAKYLIDTNLYGTLNLLEFAKCKVGKTIFLSTSRVYSIDALREIKLLEKETRFSIDSDSNRSLSGLSEKGISEIFETKRARSLYGTTKLASELFAQEYVKNHKMDITVNRCGVIAGAGQWGKTDQGVFTLWVANHFFNKKLKYTGFGGQGKQVRDLLHPFDLYTLINKQINSDLKIENKIFNVGGGLECSTSLLELTNICQKITGNKIEISSDKNTSEMDIPYYVTNNDKVEELYGWKPSYKVEKIVVNIYDWLVREEESVKEIFN